MKKNKKRISFLLASVMLMIVLLTGCGAKEVAQKAQTTAEVIKITDLAGKEYTFNKPLQKIVVQWSCAGGPFMTMSALLGEDIHNYLAGIDNSPMDYRADMWAQYSSDVPGLLDVPVIGTIDGEFNLEQVIASEAEALILPIGLQSQAAESVQPKLEAAGIPVIYVDYHAETIENHTKSTELLGKLFGKEQRAQQIIDFYLSHVNGVTARVDAVLKTEERPNTYIEVGMYGPEECGLTFDNHYMWGGISYKGGANNIGEGVIKNSAKMEPEYLLRANPDKIILTGSYWPAISESIRLGFESDEVKTRELVDGYLGRPGWGELDAVKNGEIYVIHHGLGREMYDCASLEFFAKVCFPEEFKDLDPAGTLKEYYETFLPYTFSGTWFLEY